MCTLSEVVPLSYANTRFSSAEGLSSLVEEPMPLMAFNKLQKETTLL